MGGIGDKFRKFMYGRYGSDNFNLFLMIISLILLVCSWFFGRIFYIFALAALVYSYYRMFSRNHAKRSAENAKYMSVTYRIRSVFSRYKKMFSQRKTHKFFKCPSCRQQIRIPKGHGTVEITCPKCRTSFKGTT